MLFDLSSPKRKRFIQVVYGTLAVLFAVSFVGFGIGSDAAGGIFDALGFGSGDSQTDNPEYEQRIEDAEAALATDPKDKEALLELAAVGSLAGSDAVEVDEQTGGPVLTDQALALYGDARGAWEDYLALDPKNPDDGIAAQMITVYLLLFDDAVLSASPSVTDIKEVLRGGVKTATILADAQPSANSFGTLAELAYLAGKTDIGDEAAEQAVAQTDSAERKQIERFVKRAKKQGGAFNKSLTQFAKQQQTDPEAAFESPLFQSDASAGGVGGLSGGTGAFGGN